MGVSDMQRLIAGIGSSDDGADAAVSSFPALKVGVETFSALSSFPGLVIDLAQFSGEHKPSEVDVYAKPPVIRSWTGGSSAGNDPKNPTVGTTHSVRAKDVANGTNIRGRSNSCGPHAARAVCLAELL